MGWHRVGYDWLTKLNWKNTKFFETWNIFLLPKEDFNEQESPFFFNTIGGKVDSYMIILSESNIIKSEITEEENIYLHV